MDKLGTLLRPGDPWTAATWNAFVLQMRRIMRLKAGRGLTGSVTSDGINIAIASLQNSPLLLARITRIYGTTAGVAAKQNLIFYDAQAINETGCTLTNVAPVMGRVASPAQAALVNIYPAALNSLCYIVRNKQTSGTVNAELWLPAGSETPKLKVCGASAAPVLGPEPGTVGDDQDLPILPGGFVGPR